MKTKTIPALICLFVMLSSCGKKGLNFLIAHETTFRVESASPINLPFEIATAPVTTNSSQDFKNNNTAANLIKEIKLEELKLTILSPSGKTFSFLKSIQIFISTNSTDEIELASLDNISSSTQTITLTPTAQLLDKYVKADSYLLRTRVTTKETVTQAIDIKSHIKFRIKADLF